MPPIAPAASAPLVLFSDQLLNPLGVGNVDGASELGLGFRNLRVDADNRLASPAAGATPPGQTLTFSLDPSGISSALIRPITTFRSADAAAEALAQAYGPFTSANPAGCAAIIRELQMLGGTITYDYAKAYTANLPQSPNETLRRQSGECHDVHTALAAILASLVNARRDASGWHAGSPVGQEDKVQCIGFLSETHFITAYRDPSTGKYNSIEYGQEHATQSPSARAALASVYGGLTGVWNYEIRGWDKHPALSSRAIDQAQRAVDFFSEDPGMGKRGELRLMAGEDKVQATYFLTPKLALTANVDPSSFGEGGVRAGAKVNYHSDWSREKSRGYLRLGAGVYNDFYTESVVLGDIFGSSGEALERVNVTVIGAKLDTRQELVENLSAKRLQLTAGLDANILLAIPLSADNTLRTLVQTGDISQLRGGTDIGLHGDESFTPHLSFEWAGRVRYSLDAITTGAEIYSTASPLAATNLLEQPWRLQAAAALKLQTTHGVKGRVDVGITASPGRTIVAADSPRETHYLAATFSGLGSLSAGIALTGETREASTLVGAAGFSVSSALPNTSFMKHPRVGLSAEWARATSASEAHLDAGVRLQGNF